MQQLLFPRPLPWGVNSFTFNIVHMSEGMRPCLLARDAHVRREEVFRAAGEGCLQAAGGGCRLPPQELEVTGGEKGCLTRQSPVLGGLTELTHTLH